MLPKSHVSVKKKTKTMPPGDLSKEIKSNIIAKFFEDINLHNGY